MLKTLHIKDFTLIEELDITFDEKLNILTGETGAGKSILIDAIDLALGARSSKDQIKTGKSKAVIELVVKIHPQFPRVLLEENGIDLEEENLLIFSREILPSATRSRINGVLVTQNTVQEFRKYLLDIHSQHQTYSYIQPKTHIGLLDNYGDDLHKNKLNDFSQAYSEFVIKKREYEELESNSQSFEQQCDYLNFQIKEIEQAQIEEVNELEELKEQREVLVNAEELKGLTYTSYSALYGEERSIIDFLGTIESNLTRACEYDKNLSQVLELLSDSSINLKEVADTLRDYSENLEVDNDTLSQIEERIDLLEKLKRKYGPELYNVVENLEQFKDERSKISFSSERLELLKKELKEDENELKQKAKLLSESRKQLAQKLSSLIEVELHKLEMPRASFKIDISEKEMSSNGSDIVEFFITTNFGEPLKPMAKVASGGEISRVMLAMKTIFAKSDNIDTVIFDEIDTGISGKTSQALAQELCGLAKTHQIICITHQPIIAAIADNYFYIKKVQKNETAQTEISVLDNADKQNALAILASGHLNDESLLFARKLLDKASSYKK